MLDLQTARQQVHDLHVEGSPSPVMKASLGIHGGQQDLQAFPEGVLAEILQGGGRPGACQQLRYPAMSHLTRRSQSLISRYAGSHSFPRRRRSAMPPTVDFG